ncbi:MAG: hypothetical protein JO022_16885 [Acidobacteriaceae bacterium]|nr:hypothetical protein [Acidobacteriaceae bacterium]
MIRIFVRTAVPFLIATLIAVAEVPTPEQFLGFRVGTEKKLARWDKIVAYFDAVAANSDRVRIRDLGKSTAGNRFVVLEIAAPETLKNLDHYKALERKLYLQGGTPSDAERDEIMRDGKAVVVITCNVHATEIGSSQMVLEYVHHLATDNSPQTKHILNNTILLLVPSLNPDGQVMITDWYNKNVGTPFEPSPLPWPYHPYIGHDNNRDMYMFTQKESQMTAKLIWQDWFPSIWLDEHQQGSAGSRIFVMPATDPINPNVHPLIYRLNGIYGQSQGAALEAAGKEGIIYNATYTNFWEGAMAWSGWWHNQVGLLTEVASARVATPIEQRRATYDPANPVKPTAPSPDEFQAERRRMMEHPDEPLPSPRDITPRTEYPRPWMGGTWTLRDIVDYELIATEALLVTAANEREQLLHDIYEVNKSTIEAGKKGSLGGKDKVFAIVIPVSNEEQQDRNEAADLVNRLRMAGVEVEKSVAPFEADSNKFSAGSYVIRMDQVFGRYAKDMLERQYYPEVRRGPNGPAEAPYDVSGWSLGMQMGVKTVLSGKPLPADVKLEPITQPLANEVAVDRFSGDSIAFSYRGAPEAILINRLLKAGAHVEFTHEKVLATGAVTRKLKTLAPEFVLTENEASAKAKARPAPDLVLTHAPRVALYQSWTSNMDEGWTRWVFDNYGFTYTDVHNADLQAGDLHAKYDVLILPDQKPKEILEGLDFKSIRPEYRGGIGEKGLQAIKTFLAQGGTVIAMGDSTGLMIEKFPLPVRDLKKGFTREQHFAPGAVVNIEIDAAHPLAHGTAAASYGFYINSPFFQMMEGFSSQRATVVARYPNTNVIASGWLRGEDLMAGRAAVVAVEMNPGKVVLFGLRPQHRAQTHATLPLLFNAIYWSASGENHASGAPTL